MDGLGTYIPESSKIIGQTIEQVEQEFELTCDSYGDWCYRKMDELDKLTIIRPSHIHVMGEPLSIRKFISALDSD